MKRLKMILFLLVISCFGYSQGNYTYTKDSKYWSVWSLGANVGTCLFYGDIQNYTYYKTTTNNNEWRAGVGLTFQKQFSSIVAVRGQLIFGKLSGTSRTNNIWFETNFTEVNINLKIDLINMLFSTKQRNYSFYGTLGIGKPFYQTTLMSYNNNSIIEKESNYYSFVFPFGAGIDLLLDRNWSVNAELTLRFLNNDDLDLTQGGFEYDMYSFISVGINYKFLHNIKKLKWRKNEQSMLRI